MSAAARATPWRHSACAECARRSWLLSTLSAPLDYVARSQIRLHELLALDDAELLRALGGRRRAELAERYEAFQPSELRLGAGVQAVCRHDPRYPHALRAPAAPRMLYVAGGVERLAGLCERPLVAIVGGRIASDYGREMARGLARGLAATGVGVLSGWKDGISMAAHSGVLQSSGAPLAVLGGGLSASAPARRRPLLRQICGGGCAVSELPCECAGRRWAPLASERTVAELSVATIVVEADESTGELAPARLAQARGRAVAAVPGRVTSPLSRGSNALLAGGARLIRDVPDVLELLYEIDASRTVPMAAREPHAPLEPRLRRLLERVGAGSDTPESLIGEHADHGEVLSALSELELLGALRRCASGRYVPTQPLARAP
jgi:DNA processing protein